MTCSAITLLIHTRKLINDDKALTFSKIITGKIFTRLQNILNQEQTEEKLTKLYSQAPRFDCNVSVPHNGLRSYFDILAHSIEPIFDITSQFYKNDRKKVKIPIFKEYVDIFEEMLKISDILEKVTFYLENGYSVIDRKKMNLENFKEIVDKIMSIDQTVFYRSKIAFYLPDSLQKMTNTLASVVTAYRLERSRKRGNMFQAAVDIATLNLDNYKNRAKYLSFCSNFVDPPAVAKIWNITESPIFNFVNLNFNRLSFNHHFNLPRTPLNFYSLKITDGHNILPPEGRPVSARLISYKLYNFLSNKCENLADDIIIHFHGGGFISQTSSSHITYLTELSRATMLPVLSVDYSLAPADPFPRAVDECFYAYAWALKNLTYLGTKGRRVVLMGDSAGGNLALAIAAKAILGEIRRPDGIVLAYPSCSLSLNLSLSWFISIIDPVGSFSSFASAIAAYLNIDIRSEDEQVPQFSGFNLKSINEVMTRYNFGHWIGNVAGKIWSHDICNDILVSPANFSDEMLNKLPPIRIFVGSYDPLLDDSIVFSKRLYKLGHDVDIDVLGGFPHGFLQFYGISQSINTGIDLVLQKISQLFI